MVRLPTPEVPPSSAAPAAPAPDAALVDRATAKAFWRILPLLFLCYVIAYIDRSNVGYAKLTMQRDLPGFDNGVIGFGAGIFFLGYFVLEIPGSLLVERWSARKWIARIMVTWGLIAGATAFVKTPMQFYGARFALGLAEAGFYPGVIVYLTHWFPNRTRARAMAVFLIGTPIAQLLSPKVCNVFLAIHSRWLGLTGWQWVFVGWAIPAVLLGVFVFLFLPDRPKNAPWLTAEERDALEREVERSRAGARRHVSVWRALRDPNVLLLAVVLFSISASNYTLETFLPTILEKWYKLNLSQVTTILLLPPVCAIVGQLVVAWSSDRFRERRRHAAVCQFLAAVGFTLAPLTLGHLDLTILFVALYATGNKASQVPFWALPSLMLTGPAAAASTGLINSLGNLGGFFGPAMMGWIARQTGSFLNGFYILGAVLLTAAIILVCLRVDRRAPAAEELTPAAS